MKHDFFDFISMGKTPQMKKNPRWKIGKQPLFLDYSAVCVRIKYYLHNFLLLLLFLLSGKE